MPLDSCVVVWTIRKRSTGSATLVGIGSIMAETRLPIAPFSSSLRIEIGAMTTSGSAGSSSFDSR